MQVKIKNLNFKSSRKSSGKMQATAVESFFSKLTVLQPAAPKEFFLLQWCPSKMMKNAYLILKAYFGLKIFEFLPWSFGHVEKQGSFQNLWHHNLVKKQSQYSYCLLSHQERQSDNEIWSVNRIWQEKYFSSKIMQKMRQEG